MSEETSELETKNEISEDLEFTNVTDLGPHTKSVNLKVKVLNHTEEREVSSRKDYSTHRVCEALVGDSTGTVLLTLWDDMIEKAEDDKSYLIKNGYTTLFRGNIRLNIGRYGEIADLDSDIDEVNQNENISDRTYDQPRRYPDSRPDSRSYRRDRRFTGSRRRY